MVQTRKKVYSNTGKLTSEANKRVSLVEPLFDILGQRFRTVYQSFKIFSICFPSLTASLKHVFLKTMAI